MAVVAIELMLIVVGYVVVGQSHHKTCDTTVHQDTIKMILEILNTVCLDVVMDEKHQKKHEMMETTMEMDVTVTEHQWKLVGCVEMDQLHQQTHDITVLQVIIKTIHPIQNTVCLDVEMDWRFQKKHEMMETQLVMMDVHQVETALKRAMFVEEDHQLLLIYDIIVHQGITKTMHPIQNTVSIDVEIVKKCLKKHETMETLSVMMAVTQTEHQ